ncbi:MAG: beta-lactamase family protein [Spirochaetaceae bacterium]|nr:beta-lactamase family protein [Spirochaetaceae bacterium]
MMCMCLVSCGDDYSAVYFQNGSADFDYSGIGVDENTVFELGSCGKAVAAYTALALVDEGKLELNQKIKPYLDSNLITDDPRLDEITLNQLLCHTAGFSPSYEFGVDKKIYSDPGKEFRYSGVGYIYLQNVIEKASGMSLEQAASHYVFEPLGMNNSTFENVKTITPYMNAGNAVLYALVVFVLAFVVLFLVSFIIGKVTKYKYFKFRTAYLVCFFAAGIINVIALLLIMTKVLVMFVICFAIMGIALLITRKKAKIFIACVPVIAVVILILGFTLKVRIPVTNELVSKGPNCAYSLKSTAKDMSLFCNELMKKQKSSENVFAQMFTPAVKIDEKNSWGLGIAIEASSKSGTTYWHSGINPGAQSLFVLYPEQNKYVVILTNNDDGLNFAKDKAHAFLNVDGEWDIKR